MSEQEVFAALKYRIVADARGTRRYYNSTDQLHRTDGPAVIWADEHKEWWQNGQRHRIDGPAIECMNGYKRWHINGELLTEAEFNLRVKDYE